MAFLLLRQSVASCVSLSCFLTAVFYVFGELVRKPPWNQAGNKVEAFRRFQLFLPSHRLIRYALWSFGAFILYVNIQFGRSYFETADNLIRLLGLRPGHIESNLVESCLMNLSVWFVAYCSALAYKVAKIFIRIARLYSFRSHGPRHSGGPPQSVLIVHGSIGAGHKRAAEAIAEGFRERHPDIEVTTIDIVDFAGPVFTALYKKAYLKLAETEAGSHLVGCLFDTSNHHRPGWVTRLVQQAFLLDFIEYLFVKNPDLIVNTHFLPAEIIAALRRRRLLHIPQATVITDYDAHAFWANHPTEAFFVGQQGAAANLTHANPSISLHSIKVTGIPIVPAFAEVPPKSSCITTLDLNGNNGPIVLLMSSGAMYEGRPAVFALYEQVLKVKTPLEIVVITGRQADVRNELALIPVPEHHLVRLEGFTRVIQTYMSAADIIITKPGGMTTAESLVSGLAMVIVNPYPGQEMRNTDQLLEEGVAIKCNDLYLLGYKLEVIASNKSRLADMQAKARQLGRPAAVYQICDYLAAGRYWETDPSVGNSAARHASLVKPRSHKSFLGVSIAALASQVFTGRLAQPLHAPCARQTSRLKAPMVSLFSRRVRIVQGWSLSLHTALAL